MSQLLNEDYLDLNNIEQQVVQVIKEEDFTDENIISSIYVKNRDTFRI